MQLAQLVDAIPTVQSAADRAARFPTPTTEQKVYNKGTRSIERWDGAAWVIEYTQPRVSADRGDSSVTLLFGVDEPTQRFATVFGANRVVTLSATGAVNGAGFRIVRTGLGAFTLDVGGLKTIPSGTAAFVDVQYDGAAWRLTGYGTL